VIYIDELARRIYDHVPGGAVPDGDTTDLFRAYAVLALAKGEDVTRADVHNAWVAWMLARDPAHASLIPFNELDPAVQAEDSPFVVAIRLAVDSGR
jgi:hypothetical protein